MEFGSLAGLKFWDLLGIFFTSWWNFGSPEMGGILWEFQKFLMFLLKFIEKSSRDEELL